MPFTTSPAQSRILAQTVDDYCRDTGIVDPEERLYVAELVTAMFNVGTTSPEDLRRGLETAMGPATWRV